MMFKTKNRVLLFALCVFLVLPMICEGLSFVSVASEHIYYVDAQNGLDTNSGTSKDTPFKSLSAVYTAAGNADFTVYIIGEYTLPNSAADSAASYYSGTMTLLGYDENSVVAVADGAPGFFGGKTVVDDITFKNGTNAYLEARGHKITFGDSVTTQGNHQLVQGSFSYHIAQKGDFEISSGTYNYVAMGNMAHSNVQTIPGDMRFTLTGGTVNRVIVGNMGWMDSFKGTVFDGNILIKVDGGTLKNLYAAANNYKGTYNGAAQVIFNNGTSATIDSTFENETFADGKYIVYSEKGGYVDFVYDTNGNSVAGKLKLTVPAGKCAYITNGDNTVTAYKSGEITLSPGTTTITYGEAKIFFVDAVNGLDTNSGTTKEAPFKTLSAAYTAAGNADFTVYIIGEYTLPNSAADSATSYYGGTMTLLGYDENSVIAVADSSPGFFGGKTVVDDITFKNGRNAYLEARGHKITFGDSVTTEGNPQLIQGAYNRHIAQKGNFYISSGTYTHVVMGNMAHQNVQTIPGDMLVTLNGGSINNLVIGNMGWSDSFKGSIFDGNILIKVDGGAINNIGTSQGNYACTFNGAAQIIFNNGKTATLASSFTNDTFADGKYIVYSENGGYVDFVYDANGNSVAGKINITVPENKYAAITNGNTVSKLTQSGTYTLSAGTTTIKYEDISYINSITVTSGSNEYKYIIDDTVEITNGGKITLPEIMEKDGCVFGGWYYDSEYTTPVINESTVGAAKIYARWISLDPKDLYIEGTQIRITGKQGLRFISNITHSTRDALVSLCSENSPLDDESDDFNATAGISYGTVLFPKKYVDMSSLEKNSSCTVNGVEYISATVPAKKTFETLSGYDRYTAVLVDVAESNYITDYSARTYITYKDASGMTRTVYGAPYTTNIYDVAQAIYKNGAKDEPEENRETVMNYLYTNILSKADGTDNPLSNTYRALKYDKKLTVGYLGGSITYGSSAAQDITDKDGNVTKGNILLSYANRTTTWLEQQFPDATIEHVNAGISDTATNFGNYRLEKHLMNSEGHDMPDLVFVEYTSNDWIYDDIAGVQSINDLKLQIESLVNNIYALNPYCDIVFVFSARGENDSSRPAFVEVAEHYGLQYIDMGIPMQALMTARGHRNESDGNYYYTVDNLHPSSIGYQVYFDEIEKVLTKRLIEEPVYTAEKTNRLDNAPDYMHDTLWLDPLVLSASALTISGDDTQTAGACGSSMYGTSRTSLSTANITTDSVKITGEDAKISFEFTGTTFSAIFYMSASGVNMDYTIDGGEKKNFTIDDGAFVKFQRYAHTQLFVVEQDIPYGKHTVELTFNPTSNGKVDVRLGGIGCAGAATNISEAN